jgi:hypothetical protein
MPTRSHDCVGKLASGAGVVVASSVAKVDGTDCGEGNPPTVTEGEGDDAIDRLPRASLGVRDASMNEVTY